MCYTIPASLGETRSQRGEDWIELPITTRVSLLPGIRRVEIETTVDNQAADHRLRVHFPLPVAVDGFEAEGHFDVLRRSLDLPTDTEGWVEQPVGTHPQRRWADVSDGTVGIMIANRGLPEVEVLRAGDAVQPSEERYGAEVALTLLRSVGWLSRADMSIRRGHAGPGLPTPEGQCIGEHTFHYALIPHSGGWENAFDEAYAFNAPLRAIPTAMHAGALAASGSFVQVLPSSLIVSTIKQAENGQGLIVRFWNSSQETCEARVNLWKRPKRVARCNLAERELGLLDVDSDGSICIRARGREIVTLHVTF
jgi:alpha-mannosidase